MTLFVVLDVLGAGRILGVFDSEAPARTLAEKYPHYYKLHEVELNALSSEADKWALDDEQKAFLKRFRAGLSPSSS